MTDNPHAATATDFHLPGHTVLSIGGRDALAFAQAQFMNDVAALADGQWQWNGWLTPKGRVLALFALLRLDAETLWLVLADVHAQDLAAQLQRFVFRSKVTLSPLDRRVGGRFEAPRMASGAAALSADAVELDLGGDGGPRCLSIRDVRMPDDAPAVARWQRADLAHGLPRLPQDQAGQWTPQQLSLERLRAYSVKKGCYPGQEIVARTHFLGQAKRGLTRLAGAGVGALGEVMASPVDAGAGARPIGQMVCAQGDEGLAVMPLDAGDGPFSSGGHPCTRQPLLGGLAR